MSRFARPRAAARLAVAATVAATALSSAALVAAAPAVAVGAGTAQPNLVSAVPSTRTPNITDGVVYAITEVGGEIIVGGSFTTVQNRRSTTDISQPYVLAFDPATGTVSTTFTPVLDGTVEALLPGPVANTVYVAGRFATVNGAKVKKLALLDTQTGQVVPGFRAPAMDGPVQSLALVGNELLVGGNFTTADSQPRGGLLSVDPTTGALDGYLQVQLAGHHNYNGSGAIGPVGARKLAVSPDGTRLVVLGNFKTADSLPRDQIVMIDLGSSSATVDTSWATQRYTAPCASNAFDSYVSDVQWAPDGSYFVTDATGGGGPNSLNTDGTRSLCDAAARWNAGDSGSDVAPAWIDYTGNDTLHSVAVSGSAVYVGGHERWLNNPNGSDSAGQGAVPRPGIAALDPANGLPLSWNPGRNPRGKGAYALFLADDGLYVGSDTDWFGNYAYKRQKIGFFPLTGGAAPASTSVATLPADVYQGGTAVPSGRRITYSDNWQYRPVSSSQVGQTTTLPAGLTWSTVRSAFAVGNTLFYGTSTGKFFSAPFDGSTVGTATAIDPYHDPAWSSVGTGSGGTYAGVTVNYYSELNSVTGAFFANGRLYYTLQGKGSLYWRYFTPDTGIIGGQEFSVPASPLANAAGMFASGDTLYYASSQNGSLHSMSFAGGVPDPSTDTVVDSANDWRARNLFVYGTATF